MTKELIWAVLALALILTTYLSHVEDRRHKESMAKLEARRLEVQTRMRELDKEIELGEQRMADRDREFKTKLAELDATHEERIREIDAKLAAASKTEEEMERQRKIKEELIEENRILRAERRAMESRAETPAETREALRRVHATNTRVERVNR